MNDKTITIKFEYEGKMLSAYALAKLCDISFGTIRHRLMNGWDVYEAMNTPVRPLAPNAAYSKHSVDADISAKEKSDKAKTREVGMFAQCAGRINSK